VFYHHLFLSGLLRPQPSQLMRFIALPFYLWVRLRALIFWVVRFLTLPPFECALEPSTILGSAFSNPTSFLSAP
jgi:hypothetical protein